MIQNTTGATRGGNLVGAAFNDILKEYYRPGVVDLLNSKTVLARMLAGRIRTEGVSGKYFVTDLNVGRNHGYGYAAERGRLPDPGAQRFKQCRYTMRYSYGRIKFTGPGSSASRNDVGSFVRMMDTEIAGLARDLQHNDNRVLFGDGSGRLAEIVSGAGSGPWVLANPGGFTNTGIGTQYIQEGMRVAVLNNDTSAVAVGTQPSAAFSSSYRSAFIGTVDRAAGTVTFVDGTGAATTLTKTGTQYLYIANDWSTDLDGRSFGRGHEPIGLAAIADDADPVFHDGTSYATGLGEIGVSAFPIWKSSVVDNGGTAMPFQPDLFQVLQDLMDVNADSAPDVYLTSHGVRRQYLNTLLAARRYPNTMELDGGFKALTYDDRPIVVDKDCTRGRIYGLAMDALFKAQEADYSWMDFDGSVLYRMPDEDAFGATMYGYWTLATDARNRHGLITDLLDT